MAGLALRWHEIRGSLRSVGFWSLADPDAPLNAMTERELAHTDERMPYFATIWPSAGGMAARLLEGPSLAGRRVLDLGCGLGPCGFAAAARGASVTFLDWEPRALEIVAASARAQQPPLEVTCVVADWRDPPSLEPFDLIVAADVLYEERNGPPVAAFIAGHLATDGEAWIADPGRTHSRTFPGLARDAGLHVLDTETLAPNDAEITLLRLRELPIMEGT